MSDFILDDLSMRAAKLALNGLSKREQLISRNLANIDTPGYRAQTLDFEGTLQRALRQEDRLQMESSNAAHLASPTQQAGFSVSNRPGGSLRADQNNVDIDVELLEMSQTGIQYQAITQSVSKKLQLLKLIANAR